MTRILKTDTPIKEGSALIIVLGFLAVLILVVFAFAVRMQTEYRLARGFHGRVRAQYALFQSLQIAMAQVCQRQTRSGTGPTTVWYPIRDIIDADDEALGRRVGPVLTTNFLSAPADRYIPLAVYDAAVSNGLNQGLALVPNRIERVGDFYRRCREDHRWVARDFDKVGVSYLLVNCSDYADINVPHPVGVERRYGTNTFELQLERPTDPHPWIDDGRAECGQVESLAELYAYRDRYGLSTNEAAAFFVYSRNKLGEYLRTNSFYSADAMVLPSICLTGTVVSVISNAPSIRKGFMDAGFDGSDIILKRGYLFWSTNPPPARWVPTNVTASIPPGELRGWLYTNLLDYMDGEPQPTPYNNRPLQPCQEPLPAINEICVVTDFSAHIVDTNRIEYSVTPTIVFEAWNPYIAGPTNTYRMSFPYAQFSPVAWLYPNTNSSAWFTPVPFATQNSLVYNSFGNRFGPQTIGTLSANVQFTRQTVSSVIPWAPGSPTNFPNGVSYNLRLPPLQLRHESGFLPIADQVGDTGGFYLPVTNAFTFPWGTSAVSYADFASKTGEVYHCLITNEMYTSFECVDPRFNWAIGTNRFGAVFWATNFNTHSTGAVNQATMDWLTCAYNTTNRTDYLDLTGGAPLTSHTNHNYDMYCAGAATGVMLRTVGELGYLAVAPWRTIRLYAGIEPQNQYVDRVLDTFTLVPTNRPYTRGMINPNTAHRQTLGLVFTNCRLDAHPDETIATAPIVASNLAVLAADRVIAFNYSDDVGTPSVGLVKQGPNVSDAGYGFGAIWRDSALTASLIPPADDSEFRREALIRNSYGLFSTRNLCFTVFLLASAEIGYPNDLSLGFPELREPTVPGGIFKAVAVVWRDAWTREQILQHFRYLPEDNDLIHY
jgi:hypothetical protein